MTAQTPPNTPQSSPGAEAPPKLLHIFKAGAHTDTAGTRRAFTEADVAQIAAGYSPAAHEAPLVVGHPALDAPAYGWAERLIARGRDLFAVPRQVNAAFAEAVNAGAYKKISAAFYQPHDPNNPRPGQWYLRHVGFLGAQPPGVKGLASPAFAEGDTADAAVTIAAVDATAFAEGDASAAAPEAPTPASAPETPAPAAAPAPESTTPDPEEKENPVSKEELAALQAANEALQAQINALTAEKQAAAQAARTQEHAAFAEKVIAEGRVAEADKARIVAIADAIHPVAAPVMFGEGEKQTTLYDEFKAFVESLQPKVAFGEFATKAAAAAAVPAVQYAEGAPQDAVDMDTRVRAYMAENKVDYSAAFAALTR